MKRNIKRHKMKKFTPIFLLTFLTMTLTSCAAIEGIFKAGMWTGILIVAIVLALIIWILTKLFGGGGGQ